jgi:hypothetical protein
MMVSAQTAAIKLNKLLLPLLSLSSFAVPFFLGHSQILTGVVINALLFYSAFLNKGKFYWPIILLPSLAVLARGVIFGPMTYFLLYFLPFIWIGNLLMVYLYNRFFNQGNLLSIFLSSVAKFVFLYTSTNLLFNFQLVPKIFLQTMGLNQLATALIGGFLVLPILKKYYGYLFS